mgnify:CR=1 FL=1
MEVKNSLIYQRLSNLSPFIRTLLYVHDGFVVGSGADYLIGNTETSPRDWDILIPLSKWSVAMKSIPKGSASNTFGGIKINIDNVSVDVWSQDLSDYLVNLPVRNFSIVHPKTLTVLNGHQSLSK